ncbi:MAG: chemotaxis protein CheW [Gammaproteobacteria bacterium]|nr:chemotaxis protein CheW [Gammaproteobacteria bacterium]
MTNDNEPLVEQKLALSMFLDSLLREPVEEKIAESITEQTVVELAEAPIVARPEEKVVPFQETVVSTPVESRVELEPEVVEEVPQKNGAEQAREFQAMLFKVAGLGLAVPLDELSGVVEWKDDLTEMPGHADFFLGILQHLGNSLPVVDTARLVFPADKLKALAGDDPSERITRIILIDEGRWGLAVDEVAEVITLKHEQVRWRSQRTSRKWLLGTVIDHMCALLDTRAFAEKLIKGSD